VVGRILFNSSARFSIFPALKGWWQHIRAAHPLIDVVTFFLSFYTYLCIIRGHHERLQSYKMSAMVLWLSQRGRVAFALSLFFLWATYYLWTGEHESLIATPHEWGVPRTSTASSNIIHESNNDYKNDEYHYALHSKTYTPPATPKTTSTNNEHLEDYDDHFAHHTKSFKQTATAQAQATPVHAADGGPATTLILDEFDPTPIKELCSQTNWGLSRDVVINCGGRVGGVGMRYSLSTPIHKSYLTDSTCCRQCATRNPSVC
jgi:hypothetical protein